MLLSISSQVSPHLLNFVYLNFKERESIFFVVVEEDLLFINWFMLLCTIIIIIIIAYPNHSRKTVYGNCIRPDFHTEDVHSFFFNID